MTRQWDANRLAELMLLIDLALGEYEVWCYAAESVAPEQWRKSWRDEAQRATMTRRSTMDKLQMFINYAAGKHEERLSQPQRHETT